MLLLLHSHCSMFLKHNLLMVLIKMHLFGNSL
uniref:Uncharacterized protein n=1 Tax=Anguilla anguilla TaxID=7936 RepID=A0A0E9PNV3_ANGAN